MPVILYAACSIELSNCLAAGWTDSTPCSHYKRASRSGSGIADARRSAGCKRRRNPFITPTSRSVTVLYDWQKGSTAADLAQVHRVTDDDLLQLVSP